MTKQSMISLLVNYRSKFALGALVIIGVMMLFVSKPTISGELSGFSSDDSEFAKSGKKIATEFGSRKFIQIKVNPYLDANANDLLESLKVLDDEMMKLFPNATIQSLHQSKSLLQINDKSNKKVTDVLEQATQIPLLDQLIGESKTSFLFIVWMDTSDVFKMEDFNNVLSKKYNSIQSFQYMSPFHLESEIARSIGKDLVVISGIIGVLFTLLVLFAYRNFRAVVFISIIVGICLIPTLLLFSILQLPMNLITVLVVPVILVLALSDAIHLLSGVAASEIESNYELKIKEILNDYMVPSFYTSLTTSLALLSFYFNKSENIQNFGIITGIAVMIAYFLTYFTAPFLLQFVKTTKVEFHLFSKFALVIARYKKSITMIFLLISLFFIATFSQLKFNTEMDSFIPRNTKLYSDYKELLAEFNSQLRLEIMLSSNNNSSPSNLKLQSIKLHEFVESIDGVGKVSSIKNMEDFKSKFGFAGTFIHFPAKKNPYVNDSKTAYRIDVRVKDAKFLKEVNRQIHDFVRKEKFSCQINTFSRGLLMNEVNTDVAISLLQSLSSSILLIAFLFWVITKSIRYTFYALFANLIPLMFMLLLFWIFSLDLNVLTSITAVVCIGLVVDDTIHVLYRQLILKKELKQLSFGVITTSLLLFFGFVSFLTSSFIPSRIFGSFAAITFIIAVIADLAVLPYLIEKWPSRKKS